MSNPSSSRRHFLRQSVLSAAALIGLPELVRAANAGSQQKRPLQDGDVILFQGDSITDAGRRRDRYYANDPGGMGNGYVQHIATQLLGRYPERNYQCYNRGISGNKVYQLAERWEEDCLQLRPDALSILIGVNDFWHTLSSGYAGTVEVYERDLRALLDRTRVTLPAVRLIFGEPFAVAGGTAIDERWYPAFNDYRAAAARVAKDYEAVFVPYQAIFDKALAKAPVEYWSPDGVHPSLAGSYLMAEAWLAALEN